MEVQCIQGLRYILIVHSLFHSYLHHSKNGEKYHYYCFLSHMLPITIYGQIEGATSSSFALHAFSGD